MTVAALAFIVFISHFCLSRSRIYFLERHFPAEWIVYPKPFSMPAAYNDSEASTATFRRSFVLKDSPAATQLSLRALTRWELAINGVAVSSVDARPKLEAGGP